MGFCFHDWSLCDTPRFWLPSLKDSRYEMALEMSMKSQTPQYRKFSTRSVD